MAELFKFRCSQCAKLLGVSPRKVGRPIACPKCGAELIVPIPGSDELDDATAREDDPGEFAELGIDLGFGSPLDLRPAPERVAVRPVERVVEASEAIEFLQKIAAAPDPLEAPSPLTDAEPSGAEDPGDDEAEAEPLVQTPVDPLVPRPRRSKGAAASAIDRRRDVVLPRTAVVAWSLFAILALGFSFVAGLMVGHYRWK